MPWKDEFSGFAHSEIGPIILAMAFRILVAGFFQDNSTFSMLPRPIHISVFQNQNKGLDFWRYFVAVRVFINDRKIKFPTAESEKTKTFWIARFLSQKLFSNLHRFSKRQIRVKSVFANFKHNHGPNMLHMVHL